MLDSVLRPVKDRALAPVVASPIGRVAPAALSVVGLGLTVGAAAAAWAGRPVAAVTLWLAGRLADGLDGSVARATDRVSDHGGLLDIVLDTVGYAVVPLGIAAGGGDRAIWIAVAVLLATFYVNVVSWAVLGALLEKRRAREVTGRTTSAAMPRGLVEGTETIVFFTVALALPSIARPVLWVMAGAVAVTAAERLWWARRVLR